MLKRINVLILILLSFVIVLSGCGLYGPEETMEIDPPPVTLELEGNPDLIETTDLTDSTDSTTSMDAVIDGNTQFIKQTIYFFDENNDVVPLTLEIPKVEGIGQQVLNYMTIGGPVEEILPEGFTPVLPEGTEFTMNIKTEEKLAIVDFSKDFLNYEAISPEQEKKILDAIIWSLTEFPTIEQVELRVNGYPLEEMPVWNTPVIEPLSRLDGINLELANNINIGQTTPITLYFYRSVGDFNYLVPVTRLIPKTDDIAKSTLEQLIIGPKSGSNLTSSLLPTTKILSVKVSDELVVADFDDDILGYNQELSSEVIDMIIWSITANTHIPTIQIKVRGETNSLPDDLAKPIIKPELINTTVF